MDTLDIKVSKNIYKNGKSVIIPNTEGERGLDLAGGLGVLCGNPEVGLMVLEDVDRNSIEIVHGILKEGRINVKHIEESPDVYVEVLARSKNNEVKVILKDSHNNIDTVEVDGNLVYNNNFEKGRSPMNF